MTKKLFIYGVVLTLLALVAASALHPAGVAPRTAGAFHAAPGGQVPAATQPRAPSRPGLGSVGDERRMTTLEIAKASQRTVLARCESVDVREVEGGNIFTFYEFEVLDVLKGEKGSRDLTLRILGGRIGNRQITPAVNVDFVPGQKYVLFLGATNSAGYPTTAAQSVFQVKTSPLDKSEVVAPLPTGLKLYDAKNGRRYADTPDLLPLEDFLFSVRKLDK